jgi:hypothetical protein
MTLAQLRRFALSLPEATEAPHFHMTSFRVRDKIFVTAPPEGTHAHVFVGDEQREPALALYGDWATKLSWGGKVVGLRIELATAEPAVVRDLVRSAWRAKAPKSLQQAT